MTTLRVTATWPWAHPSGFKSTDQKRAHSKAKKWARDGATVTIEEDAGGWQWRHVRTYEPPTAEPVEQQPIVEVAPPTVEDHLAEAETSLYERLMRQAPTGRDHRGRVACRHVVGGRGIR